MGNIIAGVGAILIIFMSKLLCGVKFSSEFIYKNIKNRKNLELTHCDNVELTHFARANGQHT